MRHATHLSRYGFTLIELLVVISIIALLIGILIPALSAARGAARQLKCSSNQKQFGIAFMSYATDTGGLLPYGEWGNQEGRSFDDLIAPYFGIQMDLSLIDAGISRRDEVIDAWDGVNIVLCPSDEQNGVSDRTYRMTRGPNPFAGPLAGTVAKDPATGKLIGGVGTRVRDGFPGSTPPVHVSLDWIADGAGTALMTELVSNEERGPGIPRGATLSRPQRQVSDNVGNFNQDSKFLHRALYNYTHADGHVEAIEPIESVAQDHPAGWTPAQLVDPLVDIIDVRGRWSIAAGD